MATISMPNSSCNPLPKLWLIWSRKETSIVITIAVVIRISSSLLLLLLLSVSIISLSITLLSDIHENQQRSCKRNYDKGFQHAFINVQLKFVVVACIVILCMVVMCSEEFCLFFALPKELCILLRFFFIIFEECDNPFFEGSGCFRS